MFGKILAPIAIGFVAVVTYASYVGWWLAKPARTGPSVRHGSTHARQGPYYHYFGRTHSYYHGK